MQFLGILGKSILHRFSKLLNYYIFKDFNWTENKMVQLSVVYCASQILEEQPWSGKHGSQKNGSGLGEDPIFPFFWAIT